MHHQVSVFLLMITVYQQRLMAISEDNNALPLPPPVPLVYFIGPWSLKQKLFIAALVLLAIIILVIVFWLASGGANPKPSNPPEP